MASKRTFEVNAVMNVEAKGLNDAASLAAGIMNVRRSADGTVSSLAYLKGGIGEVSQGLAELTRNAQDTAKSLEQVGIAGAKVKPPRTVKQTFRQPVTQIERDVAERTLLPQDDPRYIPRSEYTAAVSEELRRRAIRMSGNNRSAEDRNPVIGYMDQTIEYQLPTAGSVSREERQNIASSGLRHKAFRGKGRLSKRLGKSAGADVLQERYNDLVDFENPLNIARAEPFFEQFEQNRQAFDLLRRSEDNRVSPLERQAAEATLKLMRQGKFPESFAEAREGLSEAAYARSGEKYEQRKARISQGANAIRARLTNSKTKQELSEDKYKEFSSEIKTAIDALNSGDLDRAETILAKVGRDASLESQASRAVSTSYRESGKDVSFRKDISSARADVRGLEARGLLGYEELGSYEAKLDALETKYRKRGKKEESRLDLKSIRADISGISGSARVDQQRQSTESKRSSLKNRLDSVIRSLDSALSEGLQDYFDDFGALRDTLSVTGDLINDNKFDLAEFNLQSVEFAIKKAREISRAADNKTRRKGTSSKFARALKESQQAFKGMQAQSKLAIHMSPATAKRFSELAKDVDKALNVKYATDKPDFASAQVALEEMAGITKTVSRASRQHAAEHGQQRERENLSAEIEELERSIEIESQYGKITKSKSGELKATLNQAKRLLAGGDVQAAKTAINSVKNEIRSFKSQRSAEGVPETLKMRVREISVTSQDLRGKAYLLSQRGYLAPDEVSEIDDMALEAEKLASKAKFPAAREKLSRVKAIVHRAETSRKQRDSSESDATQRVRIGQRIEKALATIDDLVNKELLDPRDADVARDLLFEAATNIDFVQKALTLLAQAEGVIARGKRPFTEHGQLDSKLLSRDSVKDEISQQKEKVSEAAKLGQISSSEASRLTGLLSNAERIADRSSSGGYPVGINKAKRELKAAKGEVRRAIGGARTRKAQINQDTSKENINAQAANLGSEIDVLLENGDISTHEHAAINNDLHDALHAVSIGDLESARLSISKARAGLQRALGNKKRDSNRRRRRLSSAQITSGIASALLEISSLGGDLNLGTGQQKIDAATQQRLSAGFQQAQAALSTGDLRGAQDAFINAKQGLSHTKQVAAAISKDASRSSSKISLDRSIHKARSDLKLLLQTGVIDQRTHDYYVNILDNADRDLSKPNSLEHARRNVNIVLVAIANLNKERATTAGIERAKQSGVATNSALLAASRKINKLDPSLTGKTGIGQVELDYLRNEISAIGAMPESPERQTALKKLQLDIDEQAASAGVSAQGHALSGKVAEQQNAVEKMGYKIESLVKSADMDPALAGRLSSELASAAGSGNSDVIAAALKKIGAEVADSERDKLERKREFKQDTLSDESLSLVERARRVQKKKEPYYTTSFGQSQLTELGAKAADLERITQAREAYLAGPPAGPAGPLGTFGYPPVSETEVSAAQAALKEQMSLVKESSKETKDLTDALEKAADTIRSIFGKTTGTVVGATIDDAKSKIDVGDFEKANAEIAKLKQEVDLADAAMSAKEKEADRELRDIKHRRRKEAILAQEDELVRLGLDKNVVLDYKQKQMDADDLVKRDLDAGVPVSREAAHAQKQADIAFEKIQEADDNRRKAEAELKRGQSYRLGQTRSIIRAADAISHVGSAVISQDVRGLAQAPIGLVQASSNFVRDTAQNRIINQGWNKGNALMLTGGLVGSLAASAVATTIGRGFAAMDRADNSNKLSTIAFEDLMAQEGGGFDEVRQGITGARFSNKQLYAFSKAYDDDENFKDSEEAMFDDGETNILEDAWNWVTSKDTTPGTHISHTAARELKRREFQRQMHEVYGTGKFNMSTPQLGEYLTSSPLGLSGAFAENEADLFYRVNKDLQGSILLELQARGLNGPQVMRKLGDPRTYKDVTPEELAKVREAVGEVIPTSLQAAGGIARLENQFGLSGKTLAALDSSIRSFGVRTGLRQLPGLFYAGGMGFNTPAQNLLLGQVSDKVQEAGLAGMTPNLEDRSAFFLGAYRRGGNATRLAQGYMNSMTSMGGVINQVVGGAGGLAEQLLMVKALGEYGDIEQAVSAVREERPGFTYREGQKLLYDTTGRQVYGMAKMAEGYTTADIEGMVASFAGGEAPDDIFSERFRSTARYEANLRAEAAARGSQADTEIQITAMHEALLAGIKAEFDEITANFSSAVATFASAALGSNSAGIRITF